MAKNKNKTLPAKVVKRTLFALGHEVPHPAYDGSTRHVLDVNMHLTRWALLEDRRISAVPVWLGGPDDWSGYE